MKQTKPDIAPHDLDAERAVLGGMILSAESVEPILSKIRRCGIPTTGETPHERLFFSTANTEIFSAIVELAGKETLGLGCLCSELKHRGVLEKVGGLEYIVTLEDYVWTSEDSVFRVDYVADLARRRGMIALGVDLADLGVDTSEAIDAAIERLRALQPSASADLALVSEHADEFVDGILQLECGENTSIIPSPWNGYNFHLGGFRPRTFVCWSGRSHSGKTTLGINAAFATAKYLDLFNRPDCVVVFSLEESREALIFNIVSAITEIDSLKWSRPPVDSELARCAAEVYDSDIKALPLRIVDSKGMSGQDIIDATQEIMREQPVRFVLIDYLQKLRSCLASRNANDEQAHRHNSNILADFAHEKRNPGQPTVVALVQEDYDPKSGASALKSQGEAAIATPKFCRAVFDVADQWLTIIPPDFEDGGEFGQDFTDVQLRIKKARGGKPGSVRLRFEKPYARFIER